MIIKHFPPVCWRQILVFDNLTPPSLLPQHQIPNTDHWVTGNVFSPFPPTSPLTWEVFPLQSFFFFFSVLICRQKLFHRFWFLLTISLSSILVRFIMSFHRWGVKELCHAEIGTFFRTLFYQILSPHYDSHLISCAIWGTLNQHLRSCFMRGVSDEEIQDFFTHTDTCVCIKYLCRTPHVVPWYYLTQLLWKI